MNRYGAGADAILWKLLDMITIAVPPALPACLTIASSLSIMRLKRNHIHTIDVDRISVAGSVECICFDKTGTLTESILQLEALLLVEPTNTEDSKITAFDLWLERCDSASTQHGLDGCDTGSSFALQNSHMTI